MARVPPKRDGEGTPPEDLFETRRDDGPDLDLMKTRQDDRRGEALEDLYATRKRERPVKVPSPVDVVALELAFSPGAMIGEYAVEDQIGDGGMGVVYRAVHPMIGKRAAIKVLRHEMCADRVALERFIDEAKVVNEIGHPNIVDIFAFGRAPDGRSYFVMELLKGESLARRLERGRFALGEACHVIGVLARALEAAHEKQIVHRDLKPDNIFLCEVKGGEPLIKLLDFGIAKLVRPEKISRTQSGVIVGTPQYLSPEQGRAQEVDHRADIYALGVIAFEMLAGRPPFLSEALFEVVAQHLMEAPPRLATLVPEIPPELDEIVDRMLAKQPAGRPTLAEVCMVVDHLKLDAQVQLRDSQREALARAAPVRPTPQPVAGSPEQVPGRAPIYAPTPRTGGWLVPVLVGLVLAAAIGTGVYLLAQEVGARPQAPQAPGPAAK